MGRTHQEGVFSRLAEIVRERKLEFFVALKADENFNRPS